MSIPKSILLLPIAVLAFAVQLIPVVGIALAMFAAPLWPTVLVNGAAIGTVVEVWLRDEDGPSRAWLLLPILWFGGYLGLFVSDQFAMAALRSETEAANRGAPLPFDPRVNALVFERNGSNVLAPDPSALLLSGHLPVVYERQGGDSGATRYVAFPLVPPEQCGRGGGTNLAGAGIRVSRRGGACVMQAPEAPAGAIVELSGRESEGFERGVKVRRLTLALRMPDGATRRLVVGRAEPLPLLPMPVAGCFFAQCEIGFYRPRRAVLGAEGNGIATLVAGALGLGPARQAGTMSSAQARSRLAQAATGAMQHEVGALETILANPAARIDTWFPLLRQHPERLAPYAGRMVTALERAAGMGDPASENSRVLASLVAILPPESFRSVGARVIALYPAGTGIPWRLGAEELLSRTGDMGEAALPFLLARLEPSPGRASGAAVIGLCRIGRPAAASAGPRLLALWRADSGSHDNHGGRSSDVDRALYAALLRLGLRGTVGEVRQGWHGRWYAAAWRDISPAAPPERCDPGRSVA